MGRYEPRDLAMIPFGAYHQPEGRIGRSPSAGVAANDVGMQLRLHHVVVVDE